MKRNLLITAAVLVVMTLINFKAGAQTHTGNVALDITLTDAFEIVFTGDQGVHFTYPNAVDYSASKSVSKPAHFKVISTKPYSVTVGATAFTSSNASTPPALSIVEVSVAAALPVLASPGFTVATQVPLSTGGAPLIAAASPSTGTVFDILYTIPNASTLLNKPNNTVFTTSVLYTVTTP